MTARVDETGIPASVLGFTHTPPAGWSVDNSAMGNGGVTEWRGWSFTTDEFWTQAQRDQSRESNVRARNVFAVADGDEWNDKTVSGTFDSTLVSPAYPVTGGRGATLTYTTYYRQESPRRRARSSSPTTVPRPSPSAPTPPTCPRAPRRSPRSRRA